MPRKKEGKDKISISTYCGEVLDHLRAVEKPTPVRIRSLNGEKVRESRNAVERSVCVRVIPMVANGAFRR